MTAAHNNGHQITRGPDKDDASAALSSEQAEQQSYFARALMAGREAVGSVVEFAQVGIQTAAHSVGEFLDSIPDKAASAGNVLRHSRAVRIGTAGLAALGVVGSAALAIAESSANAKLTPTVRATAASGSRETKCVDWPPNTVTFSYANKAVLPLASQVISTYRHAKPSEKHQVKTAEMYDNSYQHVIEIDAYVPAALASGHGKGTYVLAADFAGRVIPKDMVAVETEEYPKVLSLSARTSQAIPSTYDFILDKSTTDGPSNTVGLHWAMDLHYGSNRAGYYFAESKLAKGGEIATSYSMTAPILSADARQDMAILKRVKKHQSMERLEDLAASQTLVKVCL